MKPRDQISSSADRLAIARSAARRGPRQPAVCSQCGVRTLAFCAALDEEEMLDLETIRRESSFSAGQDIFEDGERADEVFNLISGCVRLFRLIADGRRQVIGFILPGEYFGLITAEHYPYFAEAVIESRACRFQRAELEGVAERHPQLQRRMLQMAWDEVARMQEQLLLLGRKTPRERIASFLLALSERYLRLGQPENPLIIAMSRSDIADYLGLAVETVSRNFTKLKNDGVILLPESSRVILQDRESLVALADAE